MADMTQPAAEGARRLHLTPRTAFFVIVGILLVLVSVFTYGTHEVYEAITAGQGVETLDHPALQEAVEVRSPALTGAAVTLTQVAGRFGTPALGVLAVIVFTLRRRDWTPAVLLVTGLLGSLALTVVGKDIAGRVRPPQSLALPPFETSPSFPSGHTLNATVLAALVAYLVLITVVARWGRWTSLAACVAFPVGVGLSRVYLGQHWLTDVIAGLLIGLAWALSVVAAHRVWLELRGRRHHVGESPTNPGVATTSNPPT